MTRLEDLIGRSRCLLLDFDGPVAAMFAGYTAAQVTADVQAVIRDQLGHVPAEISAASGPLETLILTAAYGDDVLTRLAATACRDAELRASDVAAPTPEAADVLLAARESGRGVVIVSNNATAAIENYLSSRGLLPLVDGIAARTDDLSPALLKPHPFLIEQGLALARVPAHQAVFVGDSVSDVAAGHAAGVVTVGFANKPGKDQCLTHAGADVVTDSIQTIAAAARKVVRGQVA